MRETLREPARDTPVYRHCDVLVLGGGPGGTAAAIGAAAAGADTVLVERYGHLGGLATGGHVCFIDRMTDWDGRSGGGRRGAGVHGPLRGGAGRHHRPRA